MGASEELIEEVLDEESGEQDFEVWPENVRAVELFLACRTQWLLGPMGGILGLRAEGLEAVMRMRRVKLKDQAALFDDLQIMAAAYAEVVNEKAGA